MMEIVTYDKVVDNCGYRVEANMNNINKYLKEYKNWQDIIIARHHRFITSYIKNEYNLLGASKETEFSLKELLSIFLRIESQFEIHKELNKKVVENKEELEELKKQLYKMQLKKKVKIEVDKNKIDYMKINPQTGNIEKDKYIIDIFKEINDIAKLKQILPPQIYMTVMGLHNGLSIKEIADKRERTVNYLISTIIGRKNPRNKSEMGIKRLFENN